MSYCISIPYRYDRCFGLRETAAAVGRYDSVGLLRIVQAGTRLESAGLSHCSLLVTLFESVRPDTIASFHSRYESEFTSGQASCLHQCYEIIQSYYQGNEIFSYRFDSFYAKGDAVVLHQRYEIVQSYFQGNEMLSSRFDSFYAKGDATVLYQQFEVVQDYLSGHESWPGSFTSDRYGLRDCLTQNLEIVRHYVHGSEIWTAKHDIIDGYVRDAVVVWQSYQTLQQDFLWSVAALHDRRTPNLLETTGLYDLIVNERNAPVVSFGNRFELIVNSQIRLMSQYDAIQPEAVFAALFSLDRRFDYFFYQYLVTSEVVLDTFSGLPRQVEHSTLFEIRQCIQVTILSLYEYPEVSLLRLVTCYDIGRTSKRLVRLQEEALYEYSATLIDVLTGWEMTNKDTDIYNALTPLSEYCTDHSLWHIEMATAAHYYDPKRPATFKDTIQWRFLTAGEKHWKCEPEISEMSLESLDSFFQLRFTAQWTYEPVKTYVEAFQFESTEEGEFFDLGVWVSETVFIDVGAPPILTIPYSCDIRHYAVHVPRNESTRYIAVAPIRRFPREEIGLLAEIAVS